MLNIEKFPSCNLQLSFSKLHVYFVEELLLTDADCGKSRRKILYTVTVEFQVGPIGGSLGLIDVAIKFRMSN